MFPVPASLGSNCERGRALRNGAEEALDALQVLRPRAQPLGSPARVRALRRRRRGTPLEDLDLRASETV